jgi:hypothetical protein
MTDLPFLSESRALRGQFAAELPLEARNLCSGAETNETGRGEQEAEQQAKTSDRQHSNENSTSQRTEIETFMMTEGGLDEKSWRQERAGAAHDE